MTFRTIRIALLLIVLGLVVHYQFNDAARIARWDVPLFVVVYPVNADGSETAERYIAGLDESDFRPIAEAMRREAARYAIELDPPIYVQLARSGDSSPPPQPVNGRWYERFGWVARLRWWRWTFDDQELDPDIVVVARFHDPATNPRLPHSTGLERIRIAVANLYATRAMQGQNNVVVLHELLHTVGASDKYDLATNLPSFPHGYAEPDRAPVYPQRRAEIMAGRIPIGPSEALQAPELSRTLIGPETARELGWID